MATRKTTPRGKTKTTKTAKTTRKSSAAKTRQKTVAAPARKTAAKKVSQKPNIIRQLRFLHTIGALLAAAGIASVVLLMKAIELPLTVSYVTRDILTSTTETFFVPAERILLDYDIRWSLVALLSICGLYSLLLATRWQKSYAAALNGRVHLWRWIMIGLTGMLAVKVIGMLSGVENLYLLKLMAGATVLSAAFSWLAERQTNAVNHPSWSSYLLALVSGILPWLVIGGQLLFTYVYGLVRLPWFVYAAAAAGFLGFLLIGLNQLLQYRGRKRYGDYAFAERNYVLSELLTKIALVTILIFAFSR